MNGTNAPPYVVAALRSLISVRSRLQSDAPAGQRQIARLVTSFFDDRAGAWIRNASAADYRAAVQAAMGDTVNDED